MPLPGSAWSSGFSIGFGPFNLTPSGRNPDLMQVLAYTPTEKLLYDYGESEGFFILTTSSGIPPSMLFAVSPYYAYQWFGLNGQNQLTTVYNPFYNPYGFSQFSNLI